MRITYIGHAGLFVETAHGSILCDPWFNPAFFGSWFPFPSNEDIDPATIGRPDYLYVSHLHHDHFDAAYLRDHVSKDARVLLPAYPTDHLENALADLGFHSFVRTKNSDPMEVDGLQLMIVALVAPTDGPIGDSGLAVDDGTAVLFNQNDSRPLDLQPLMDFGPYDGHFLQFSGAIWYPFVYRFPARLKANLGRKKRINEMTRAARYAQELGAREVFPNAGPPCFLDDDLFEYNDFDDDPTNIFPDQTVFLRFLQDRGRRNGHLMIPGTTIDLDHERCRVEHPLPDDEVHSLFERKREYLEAYRARTKAMVQAERSSWPNGRVDVLSSLREWFEPLLDLADITCAGVNGRVLLDLADPQGGPSEGIVVDFIGRRVDRWDGVPCRYRFGIDRRLVETCIVEHHEDWVNELFLSCRFEAERDGPFNEYIYNFFKCLSPERIEYAEGYYAGLRPETELCRLDGYIVQRRCPHLKSDLTRFGVVEDGVLTCQMHGWQFDLATGRCLTTDDDDHVLYSVPADQVPADQLPGSASR